MTHPTATVAPDAPSASGSSGAPVTRLRPVVYASPTPQGLHVRGWSSSFTVTGGPGLWRLWQALARRLAEGLPPGEPPLPGAPAKLSGAVSLILEQLREHDMLVRVPVGWAESGDATLPRPDLARWLESVAADPVRAWERLRSARVTVAGAGPAADAAIRALTGAGVEAIPALAGGDGVETGPAGTGVETGPAGTGVETGPAGTGPADRVRLAAGSGVTVLAGCGEEAGFVLPVGHASVALADRVAARLGLPTAGAGRPPYPLGALVGSAAAHRLICALAGLPDPAVEAATLVADGPPPATRPDEAVLVARLDPLRATYHPWLPIAVPAGAATGTDLDAVSRRLDALGDPELGPLPEPDHADLPQLPAMLALAGAHLGVATTADAARLDAVLRAAEHGLATSDRPVAVGTDARHATGTALRRLADAAVRQLPATPVAEPDWAGSAVARRWWKALTLRLSVPAVLRLRRLGTDVVHAEIMAGDARMAWAVEATPADAAALAALAATGLAQARAAGVPVPGPLSLVGAAPAWRPDNGPEVGWTDHTWSWPAGVVNAEERLQAGLRLALAGRQVELRPYPVAPGPGRPTIVEELARALTATSFVAVTYLARPQ